jgi:hypothetical protein
MTDRPRALAVLIAVFLLGCIVGSGGMYFGLRHYKSLDTKVSQNFPPGPQQGRQRLRELLQLTPDQETQFGKIMAESRKQMEAVRVQDQPQIEKIFSEQQPKIEAIFAETNKKLMAALNPDQQKKFESLQKEMNSRRRHSPYTGREGGHGMDGGRRMDAGRGMENGSGVGPPPPPPQP